MWGFGNRRDLKGYYEKLCRRGGEWNSLPAFDETVAAFERHWGTGAGHAAVGGFCKEARQGTYLTGMLRSLSGAAALSAARNMVRRRPLRGIAAGSVACATGWSWIASSDEVTCDIGRFVGFVDGHIHGFLYASITLQILAGTTDVDRIPHPARDGLIDHLRQGGMPNIPAATLTRYPEHAVVLLARYWQVDAKTVEVLRSLLVGDTVGDITANELVEVARHLAKPA